MNISAGDITDFEMVLKRNDASKNDYTLDLINNLEDDKTNVERIEAYFQVTNKSTEIKQKYDAGPGNLWLNHFENDLKKGLFNS